MAAMRILQQASKDVTSGCRKIHASLQCVLQKCPVFRWFIGQYRNNGMKQMRVNRFSTKTEKNQVRAQQFQQRNSGFGKDFCTARTVNRSSQTISAPAARAIRHRVYFVCTGRGTTLNKVTTHADKNQIGAGLPADFSELIGVPVMKSYIHMLYCNSHKISIFLFL